MVVRLSAGQAGELCGVARSVPGADARAGQVGREGAATRPHRTTHSQAPPAPKTPPTHPQHTATHANKGLLATEVVA